MCENQSILDIGKTTLPKSSRKKSKFVDTHGTEEYDDITNPLHFFSKQLSLEPNHMNNIRMSMEGTYGDVSRSPSASSLENVFLAEGCSCIAFSEQTNKNGMSSEEVLLVSITC